MTQSATATKPPYVYTNPQPISYYNCGSCSPNSAYGAFKYQLDKINADPTILPNTKLVLDIIDDQGTAGNGFFGAYELLKRGNVILTGPGTSTPSINAALVAQQFNVPLIAYSASSPALSVKSLYPNFFRICQNDAQQGEWMAWAASVQFKWTRVAVLSTNDAYGAAAAKFSEVARSRFNMTILAEQTIPLGVTKDQARVVLERLKQTGALVTVYFGQSAEWAVVVDVGYDLGMFSTQRAWLVSDVVVGSGSNVRNITNMTHREKAIGLIGIKADGGTGLPKWTEFTNGLMARNITGLHKLESFRLTTTVGMTEYTPFSGDVANAMAYALHDLIEIQNKSTWTPAELLAAVKRLDFGGISGRVVFDQNYDRVGIRWQIWNLQSDIEWRKVASLDSGYETWVEDGPIQWNDGTSNIPRDAPLPEPLPNSKLSYSEATGLITVAAIALIIVAVNMGAVIWLRASRVIHAASPVMLVLVLLGGASVISSVLISTMEQTTWRCTLKQWLFNLGFMLSVGAMLLRTFRVHKIFNNSKLRVMSLSDAVLFRALSKFIIFDIVVLSLRTGLAPYVVDEYGVCEFNSGGEQQAATAITIILIVGKALMVIAAAYLSYAVRNLPQLYNESTYLGLAIYNTLLIGAAWVGIRYGIDLKDRPNAVTVFESAIMLAATAVTLTLVFAPKWYDVYAAEKHRMYFNAVRNRAKAGKKRSTGTDESETGSSSLTFTPSVRPSIAGVAGAAGADKSKRTDTSPQNQEEVDALLEFALSDQTRCLEAAFKDIEQATTRVADKKKELKKVADTIFQIQCEIDFFRQVSKDMSSAQVAALFKTHLKEFHASSDSVAGHQSIAPPKGSPAVSSAYAVLKRSMEIAARASVISTTTGAPTAATSKPLPRSKTLLPRLHSAGKVGSGLSPSPRGEGIGLEPSPTVVPGQESPIPVEFGGSEQSPTVVPGQESPIPVELGESTSAPDDASVAPVHAARRSESNQGIELTAVNLDPLTLNADENGKGAGGDPIASKS